MFHSVYTDTNNSEAESKDPLNLERCMRFYPHDDNQGGFFCAVFEKLAADESGFVDDPSLLEDAWNNENIRQKPVMDELEEFARWYEDEVKKQDDIQGIPEELR